jgi:hypothetical protein
MLMPLTAQRLDVLANHSGSAFLTLGSPALGPFGLAADTPSVAVFLNMRHALLERITAFRTEEVTVMPMLAECHNVLS